MSMVKWKGRTSSSLLSQLRMRKRRSRTRRERKQQKDKEKDDDPENSEEKESADGNVYVSKKLHETWWCLYLPINESEIVGKWFAGIHETKRSKDYA